MSRAKASTAPRQSPESPPQRHLPSRKRNLQESFIVKGFPVKREDELNIKPKYSPRSPLEVVRSSTDFTGLSYIFITGPCALLRKNSFLNLKIKRKR
ncbi:hypothetical protein L596_006989 [Steinernema carpocapsae]|uniref:Uncharacterized protein n=1 Tax=Steinernema carpocapsae TaxID=34508 RepID=A0A4U5P7U7_STECR|nr:hypothetical protein L596_006989 [Steinernema carpocapsae]